MELTPGLRPVAILAARHSHPIRASSHRKESNPAFPAVPDPLQRVRLQLRSARTHDNGAALRCSASFPARPRSPGFFSLVLFENWQPDRDRGAFSEFADQLDVPAMKFERSLYHQQTQSGARTGAHIAPAMERLE